MISPRFPYQGEVCHSSAKQSGEQRTKQCKVKEPNTWVGVIAGGILTLQKIVFSMYNVCDRIGIGGDLSLLKEEPEY